MAMESKSATASRRRAVSVSRLAGVPVALLMFVALNWITTYNGFHAVQGRPIAVLLAVVVVFALASWLTQANPGVGLVAGVTVVGLIVLGLLEWGQVPLSILEWETDPRRLVGHGAIEPIVTALAVVLLTSGFRSRRADSKR